MTSKEQIIEIRDYECPFLMTSSWLLDNIDIYKGRIYKVLSNSLIIPCTTSFLTIAARINLAYITALFSVIC